VKREPIQLEPTTPWGLLFYDRVGSAPAIVGIAIGLALFAFFLVYTRIFGPGIGRLEHLTSPNLWIGELLQCLLIGLAPAVSTASVRAVQGDLDELRPFLDVRDDALRELRGRVLRYSRGRLLAFGVAAIVGVVFFVMGDAEIWVGGKPPSVFHPDAIWLFFRNSLLWWVIVRGMSLELNIARGFSTLGEHLGAIDLLDRGPLLIFGRRGLRSVLLWMVFVSLYSLMYAGGWAADILAPALLGVVAFAFAAFLLPVLGARRRVRELKQAELARIRVEIRNARDRVLGGEGEASLAGGRLADLVAYEQRIAAVAEWPFDGNTVMRFALYLALGIGSWIGAALVERAIESALL
jgi:hypothetical protein